MLRHEVAVLRRANPRPRLDWADWVVRCARAAVAPRTALPSSGHPACRVPERGHRFQPAVSCRRLVLVEEPAPYRSTPNPASRLPRASPPRALKANRERGHAGGPGPGVLIVSWTSAPHTRVPPVGVRHARNRWVVPGCRPVAVVVKDGRMPPPWAMVFVAIVLNDVAPGPRRWMTHVPAGWAPVMKAWTLIDVAVIARSGQDPPPAHSVPTLRICSWSAPDRSGRWRGRDGGDAEGQRRDGVGRRQAVTGNRGAETARPPEGLQLPGRGRPHRELHLGHVAPVRLS